MAALIGMSSELGLTILPVFLILYALLVIYCLYDVVRATFNDPFHKRVWLLVILAIPLFGSIAYLIFGKKQKV